MIYQDLIKRISFDLSDSLVDFEIVWTEFIYIHICLFGILIADIWSLNNIKTFVWLLESGDEIIQCFENVCILLSVVMNIIISTCHENSYGFVVFICVVVPSSIDAD